MIRAILFDLFGTVVAYGDTRVGTELAWRGVYQVMCELGATVPFESFAPDWGRQLQTPLTATEDSAETPFLSKILRLFTSYDLPRDHDAALRAAWACLDGWDQHLYLPDDAWITLDRLRQTRRVVLVSNFDHPPYVHQLLERLKLATRFDSMLISGELRIDKPDPRIFQLGLQAAEVSAEEALFVGDNVVADIQGARQAGIRAVLIDRRRRHQDDYALHTPWRIEALGQLEQTIAGIEG